MPYQRAQILGDQGHIEIEIPVNAPIDTPSKVWLRTKTSSEEFTIQPVDQYTLQGDAFSKAIIDGTGVLPSLDDAIGNMKTIDAIVESALKNSVGTSIKQATQPNKIHLTIRILYFDG